LQNSEADDSPRVEEQGGMEYWSIGVVGDETVGLGKLGIAGISF